jgi:hypothetical protein
MTRRLNRILTIVTAAVLVTAGWSVVGHTAWAATRDYLSAGLQLDSWAEPLLVFGGMLTLSVTVTRVLERASSLVTRDRARPQRVRASSPVRTEL